MTQHTDIKDPAEVIPFTADFTNSLATYGASETISSVLSVTATVDGSGASASEILSGSAQIAGGNRSVIQLLTGGVDGTDYKIKIEIKTSSNYELVTAGVVPVRSK